MRKRSAGALVVVALTACDSDDRTYTLYRHSTTDRAVRVDFATFDADERAAYNQENCQNIADRMNAALGPQSLVRYRCEKGRYGK